ncbi:MAG: DUF5658 family protein [Chthonomonadales bacterium]
MKQDTASSKAHAFYTYVLPETTILAAVGLADLLSTVYWIATGHAMEANPFMAGVLKALGPWGFSLLKAALLGGPLAVAEWARHRHPRFVRWALRAAIVLYVGAYALNWLHANGPSPKGLYHPSGEV